MAHATYIHNILPGTDGTSPHFKVHDAHPDYSELTPFGCKCYYFVPSDDRPNKLSPRALPACYLGQDTERNGAIVYVPSLKRITTAYHLVFSKNSYLTKDDIDGSPRFRIPTSKRVTINVGNHIPVREGGETGGSQARGGS